VRAVRCALSVSHSHVLAMRDRQSEWAGLRNSPPLHNDATVKQAIANVVKDRATGGYRRFWARLRLEGYDRINHKRVYRVMRDVGWLLYRHGEKPFEIRKHEGKVAVKESDVRWCSDGLELSCDKGERVRVAFALDFCDREIMSCMATIKGIDAALVGDLIMQVVENRFGPNGKPPEHIEWLTDNGSCYTAAETRSFTKQLRLKPVTSPQSNGMADSFVKTLKRDYTKLAERPDSQKVMAQLPKSFDDYNSYHP
jgi:putative transposase